MAAASKAMADGDFSQPVSVTSRDEVGDLARAFDQMRSELAEDEVLEPSHPGTDPSTDAPTDTRRVVAVRRKGCSNSRLPDKSRSSECSDVP